MGIFTRPESPYWWMYLEVIKRKESTHIAIGRTVTQRRDSKRQAEELYYRRMSECAAQAHQLTTARAPITFATFAEDYKRDIVTHHKGADREREIIARLVAAFGPQQLTAIDMPAVQAWAATRRASVSASTVNREVDLLKAMLRTAVPAYLRASPIAGLKRLPVTPPPRRLLTDDEERRLLAAATEPHDYAMLVLGIDTLVRMGDLLDLRRGDRVGTWITVRDPKSGAPYDVPLSPRAAAALEALPGDDPFYFAVFRQALNPRDWRGAVRQRLERLCKLAEVPFGRRHGGITFHWATRRTGATRLLIAKGQPVSVVQRIGNWRTPDVLLKVYAEAQRDDLARAVGQAPPGARAQAAAAIQAFLEDGGDLEALRAELEAAAAPGDRSQSVPSDPAAAQKS